jgi:hypothetical protein
MSCGRFSVISINSVLYCWKWKCITTYYQLITNTTVLINFSWVSLITLLNPLLISDFRMFIPGCILKWGSDRLSPFVHQHIFFYFKKNLMNRREITCYFPAHYHCMTDLMEIVQSNDWSEIIFYVMTWVNITVFNNVRTNFSTFVVLSTPHCSWNKTSDRHQLHSPPLPPITNSLPPHT